MPVIHASALVNLDWKDIDIAPLLGRITMIETQLAQLQQGSADLQKIGERIETERRAREGSQKARDEPVIAGLQVEPDTLRLRVLDAELRARLSGVGDVTAPVMDIANTALPVRCAFIVENIASGLAFTDLPGAVVFLGKGYAVGGLGQVPWLRNVPVFYWGDIDTHGLAILHRLRTHVPHVRSLMMDEATLLAFAHLLGEEEKQAHAAELECLTDAERTLYSDLMVGRFGTRVRLEQERIDWAWAWARIDRIVSELRRG